MSFQLLFLFSFLRQESSSSSSSVPPYSNDLTCTSSSSPPPSSLTPTPGSALLPESADPPTKTTTTSINRFFGGSWVKMHYHRGEVELTVAERNCYLVKCGTYFPQKTAEKPL